MTQTRRVIAGGGTGGHLDPGIAVAEALLEIEPDAKVLFVGTERGIKRTAVTEADARFEAYVTRIRAQAEQAEQAEQPPSQ